MHALAYSLVFHLITICEALEFSHHPQDQTSVEGSVVEMTCVIEEDVPHSSLSWSRNDIKFTKGKKILESSPLRYRTVSVDIGLLSGKSTYYKLEIINSMYSDSGKYTCAVNKNGVELKSKPAHLTVNQLPDPIYPICGKIKNPVQEGHHVNLRCEGEILNPPIRLRLSKFIASENPESKILNTQWTTPLIHSFIANRGDTNAIFTCQLKTPADDSIVRNCSIGPLNVWYKPNVTIQHTGTTLSGREAIFICQTNANPPVIDFTWQFDPPLNIDRYDVDDIGQVMRILRVTIDDNGLIVKCTAINTVDQVTNQVIMEVIDNVKEEKPKTNAIESPSQTSRKKKNISLSVLLAVVAVLVLVIVFAIIIPVYYFCVCAKKDETTLVVAQPEVYFEPQDRMTLPLSNKRHSVLWRRSFGAQVPIDRDVDAMYLEIQSDHYIFTPDSRGNTLPY